MVRASQQCDPDLIVNGNLIAVLNDHILLHLFCDGTAEAGASAWVGECTQAMSTPLATCYLITSIASASNRKIYIDSEYSMELRAVRESGHSPGPRQTEGACIIVLCTTPRTSTAENTLNAVYVCIYVHMLSLIHISEPTRPY